MNNLKIFFEMASMVFKNADQSRKELNYVYSDDKNLVVTNGKILLVYDKLAARLSFEPGYYNLAKIGKEYRLVRADFKANYPNYQAIIPECTCKPITNIIFTKKEYMKNLIKLQDVARNNCNGYLRESFFEVVQKSGLKYEVFTPDRKYSYASPILLKADNLQVIGMPLRYEE